MEIAMSVAVMERVDDETLVEKATVECGECLEQVSEVSEVKSGTEVCEDCVASFYTSCDDCSDITPDGDVTTVDRGYRTVCDDCLDNYACCSRCDEHVDTDQMNSIYSGDQHVCDRCYDYYYTYCDYCDTAVENDDSDHYHDGDESTGCCDSPALHFTMPCGTVQDDIVEVTLPDGSISSDGMQEIRRLIISTLGYDDYILRDRLISAVWNVGTEYVNKEGKFSKRVARYLHKTWSAKASDDLLSKIGQAAQRASVGGTKRVAFTRQLNLSAEEFYHEGSCWWSEYSYSRCTLKSNGGIGIRTFSETWHGEVTGRAWAFPLRKTEDGLVVTFDTATADAFVVFNGYGELAESEQGRVLAATVEGWTSKRVSFDPGNMYVNSGGFLVGPTDLVQEAPDWLGISLEMHSDLYLSETKNESKVAA